MAVAAAMFGDDVPILGDDDPNGPRVGPQARPRTGSGVDLDRPAERTGVHRVFVVVEANEAGVFDTEAATAWKPSRRGL
jgi:hypothetical protein